MTLAVPTTQCGTSRRGGMLRTLGKVERQARELDRVFKKQAKRQDIRAQRSSITSSASSADRSMQKRINDMRKDAAKSKKGKK